MGLSKVSAIKKLTARQTTVRATADPVSTDFGMQERRITEMAAVRVLVRWVRENGMSRDIPLKP